MTKLHQLAHLGQSVWLDYIRRSFIESGELQVWVDKGLRGVTSNPSIFEKAIAGSNDYDAELRELVADGCSVQEIYESLAFKDIADAADVLRPVYDRTRGLDGYVSLEASPDLAHDTEGTIAQVKRFHRALGRPNVMFKVPATPAGIPAIRALIASGININVTLIFAVDQYQRVAEAYISGLEELVASGGDVSQVASVASCFVSRVDTAVDRELETLGESELRGKIAIANANATYGRFREVFASERWQRLAARGARVQRVLWGSTSTKNASYPDTLYVDSLIGPHTVNTVPPETLQLFLDHGVVALSLEKGLDTAKQQLTRLAELGIDLDTITQQLLDDGVAAFAQAFEGLLDSISKRREELLSSWEKLSISLGDYGVAVDEELARLDDRQVLDRIWSHDHTVWKPEPTEIANRLGWLHIADKMIADLECIDALVEDIRADGYTQVLLLGMGGSSLAPEVFSEVFGSSQDTDGLALTVLDSTDPSAILAEAQRIDPARALFVVSSKSGTTTETLSLFRFLYNRVADRLGIDKAGQHFVAITDPDTPLSELAQDFDFRATFPNDPNIGGRYAALSFFGLVPAALVGVDLELLLNRALTMACNCEEPHYASDGRNSGLLLGTVLGELAKAGRDKLTLVLSPPIASFANWVEQLVAESTGKEGKGIVPVVGEPLGPPEAYGNDRLFAYLRMDADERATDWNKPLDTALESLEAAGHPVVRINLHDRYDVGEQLFLWEMATAVAGHLMGINPFNQPNVEAAKDRAREMVAQYKEGGSLPDGDTAPLSADRLKEFIQRANTDSYVSLQAYLQPTAEMDAALQALRTGLRDRYRLATTVGYGPRFLHSTGQLHKGDAGKGLFIQLVTDDLRRYSDSDHSDGDVDIPDEAGSAGSSLTFGMLKSAQALGDWQALLDTGRAIVRFRLGPDPAKEILRVAADLV